MIFVLGIIFEIPRFVEITDNELSYKLMLDRDWRKISWSDVGAFHEIFRGVKLSIHDENIVLNLWMLSKKDRISFSQLISDKI